VSPVLSRFFVRTVTVALLLSSHPLLIAANAGWPNGACGDVHSRSAPLDPARSDFGRIAIVVALALFVGLLAAGCGSASSQTAKTLVFADGRFQAKSFVDPRVGSNMWLPLKPGMQWVRDGTTLVGNRAGPHKVLSTVTDVIRVIGGVKTVAVLDHSVDSGQVVQQSLDYFAQDKSGNIWDFGCPDDGWRRAARCESARRRRRSTRPPSSTRRGGSSPSTRLGWPASRARSRVS